MLDAKEMARLVREEDGDREITTSTVHYYTQLGILPSAVGRGKGAFAPEHLARLRLARRLRREGMSLATIRDELAKLPRKDLDKEVADSETLLAVAPPRSIGPKSSDARGAAAPRGIESAQGAVAARSGNRTLRFRGGFALQVPPSIPDEFVSRIYAAVEKVLDKEMPPSLRGQGGSR
jgi:DNA-binding transcriptional MerR regulator